MSKTLEFKNFQVLGVTNFLIKLKLKNLASIGRSRLVKRLTEKLKEQDEDIKQMRGDYFEKDTDGEFVVKNDKLQLIKGKKLEDANKAFEELKNTEAVVEFTEYSKKLKAFYDALVDYPYELDGTDAENYELVLLQLENNFEGEDK